MGIKGGRRRDIKTSARRTCQKSMSRGSFSVFATLKPRAAPRKSATEHAHATRKPSSWGLNDVHRRAAARPWTRACPVMVRAVVAARAAVAVHGRFVSFFPPESRFPSYVHDGRISAQDRPPLSCDHLLQGPGGSGTPIWESTVEPVSGEGQRREEWKRGEKSCGERAA